MCVQGVCNPNLHSPIKLINLKADPAQPTALCFKILSQKCLQEGESLLARLQSVCARSDIDSRTDIFQRSVVKSIEQVRSYQITAFIQHQSQVGYWLEELHDRRVDVTRIHDRIKEKLNRLVFLACYYLCITLLPM